MVEQRLEPEVEEILEHIADNKNFLLNGGAGSGKTYSLVQLIKEIIKRKPTHKIACITYTNAAVDEINKRINDDNLSVHTIHQFLWSNISSFQNELKESLIELLDKDDINFKEIDEIKYKEYRDISNGIISHDDVIPLAEAMFRKYKKLCDILNGKYQYIFIDEYQDTFPNVIKVFLEYLQRSQIKTIIGCFGDSMQSIYDKGIGNINQYIQSGNISEVTKKQNRRNPKLVYELANKLRTDNIVQTHSNDLSAPNMTPSGVKEGNICFYYSDSGEIDDKINILKEKLSWDCQSSGQTKQLYLTHNLIAQNSAYKVLFDIYNSDGIISYKSKLKNKIKGSGLIENINDLTFSEVIDYASNNNCSIRMSQAEEEFIEENLDLYEFAKLQKFYNLSKIPHNKDALIRPDSHDNLIAHLFKIEKIIFLYRQNNFSEFIKKSEYKIEKMADKKILRETINHLSSMNDCTIEDVINYANEKGICIIDDRLEKYIEECAYQYRRVKPLEYKIFKALYDYIEGFTPFSTQHNVKGEEYDNVLVVLDNGGWNNYNFASLFDETLDIKDTIKERTEKLFYVCCTRSKENLVVYYHRPNSNVLRTAKSWFDEANIHQI